MKLLDSFTGFLRRRSRSFIVAASILFIAGLWTVGYFIGINISTSLFYLVPIITISWFAGRKWGLFASLLSSISLLMVEWASGRLSGARTVIVLWNAVAPFGIFVVVVTILSSLKSALAREEKLSRTDPLTGLFNRRYFGELVAAELARARRYGHPVSLAYLDLDNFKTVNDRFGHDAGDRLLVEVAGLFKSSLRATDVVARLGGDEFSMLLVETGAEPGMKVIMNLRESLMGAMRREGWPVSASIGLVTFMSAPAGLDEMLTEADALMYEVKSAGKNAVKQKVMAG